MFPDTDGRLVRMCRDAFRRYLPAAPASALDIGCGTGQYLGAMAETVAECWGVDLLDTNVAYARATRPRLHVVQGDMRTVRLGRTFDLVTSSATAVVCAPDDDVSARWHVRGARPRGHALDRGTRSMPELPRRGRLRERIDGRVDAPALQATSVALHVLDRRGAHVSSARGSAHSGEADVED